MTGIYFNDPSFPHQPYADAVQSAFEAAGMGAVEYYTHDTERGLGISYLWRPSAAKEGGTSLQPAEGTYLGHGVMLLWTEEQGWGFNALDAESDPAWDSEDPVPVAKFADLDDLVEFARLLLAGEPDDASASEREWQHADALRAALRDRAGRVSR
ncbi:hypothetical protein ACGF0D_43020 [Kitasatospora sp. NPDC048298]|uniref:hypothetical protein n=1 Tax=Kitasatospora sp. NPDC048298 TaxID=3364049 RepID=UPI00371D6AFE